MLGPMIRPKAFLNGCLIQLSVAWWLAAVALGGLVEDGVPRRVFEAGAERVLIAIGPDSARDQDSGRRLRVHPEVAVPVARRAGVAPLAARFRAEAWRESGLGGYYLFLYRDGASALAAAERLWAEGIAASPLLERKREPRFRPQDPLYRRQWHLRNDGRFEAKPGIDLNIKGAWAKYLGRGIRVAIVDDGLELNHPDLKANTRGSWHYDFNRGQALPRPGRLDAHGTAVAGLVGAASNSAGGVGVAPSAGLVGLRLIGAPATDRQEQRALVHERDVIHIYNNSWGPSDTGQVVEGPAR